MKNPIIDKTIKPTKMCLSKPVHFRLQNYKGKVVFTCRMIHSVPLLMSVIQIFYRDKMAAVAHLIGSDQIPKPSQVCLIMVLNKSVYF